MKTLKKDFFTKYGVLSISILLFIFFSLASDVFLTWKNMGVIAVGQVIVGFFAMAALLPLIAGEFDISLGYMIGFTIMFGAMVARTGASAAVVMLSMLGIALLCGVFNGVVAVVLRVPSTISTLGIGMLFYGLTLSVNDGQAITGVVPEVMRTIVKTKFLGFNMSVWILIAFALLLYYLLEHTPFGKHIYEVGLSERVAYLAGVRTKFVRFMSFVWQVSTLVSARLFHLVNRATLIRTPGRHTCCRD